MDGTSWRDLMRGACLLIHLCDNNSATGDVTGEGAESWPAEIFVAHATLEPSELQDLADLMPRLLEIKGQTSTPITFHLQVELGDGQELPPQELAEKVNVILSEVKEGFRLSNNSIDTQVTRPSI